MITYHESDPRLAVLIDRLNKLVQTNDYRIPNDKDKLAEIVHLANQIYETLRMNAVFPLTDVQSSGLVLLKSLPLDPALNDLRNRAEGAIDICARFSGFVSRIELQNLGIDTPLQATGTVTDSASVPTDSVPVFETGTLAVETSQFDTEKKTGVFQNPDTAEF